MKNRFIFCSNNGSQLQVWKQGSSFVKGKSLLHLTRSWKSIRLFQSKGFSKTSSGAAHAERQRPPLQILNLRGADKKRARKSSQSNVALNSQ